MPRDHRFHNNQHIQSNCGDLTLKGNIQTVVRNYEGLAYQAERDGNRAQAHTLFQHADHYKRVMKGER